MAAPVMERQLSEVSGTDSTIIWYIEKHVIRSYYYNWKHTGALL